jgi:hypothetical protein
MLIEGSMNFVIQHSEISNQQFQQPKA